MFERVIVIHAGLLLVGCGADASRATNNVAPRDAGEPEHTTLWSARFGGDDSVWPRAIAVGADGDVVVTGGVRGSLNLPGAEPAIGELDMFIVKLDSSGTPLWARRFGNAQGFGVAVDADGRIFVAGETDASAEYGTGVVEVSGRCAALLLSLDGDGDAIWSQGFDALSSDPHRCAVGTSVDVDDSGELVFTGMASEAVDLGLGPMGGPGWSLFVSRFDPGGQAMWTHATPATVYAPRGVVSASGTALVATTFCGTLDFGLPVSLPQEACYPQSDGPGAGVTSFDSHGTEIDAHAYAAMKSLAVDATPDDGVVLAGNISGTVHLGTMSVHGGDFTNWELHTDMVLAGFDRSRTATRASVHAGARASAIAADAQGGSALVGTITASLDLGGGAVAKAPEPNTADMFVARLDAGGTGRWIRSFAVPTGSDPFLVEVDRAGAPIVAVRLLGAVDFGDLAPIGAMDMVIFKLAP